MSSEKEYRITKVYIQRGFIERTIMASSSQEAIDKSEEEDDDIGEILWDSDVEHIDTYDMDA